MFALERAAPIGIKHGMDGADESHCPALDGTPATGAAPKGRRAAAVWFAGRFGSGESTVANLVARAPAARGRHTVPREGDTLRRRPARGQTSRAATPGRAGV